MDLNLFYRSRIDSLSVQINARRMKNRYFVAGEIVSFLIFIGFLVAMTHWGVTFPLVMAAALSLAAYAMVRRGDVRNGEQTERLMALRTVYLNEQKYLNGDFTAFSTGSEYTDPKHPFTFDMDIFGRESLFNRINRTVTTGGSDELARRLSSTGNTPAEADDTRAAVDELAEREAFRSEFVACGAGKKIDSNAIRQAMGNIRQAAMPRWGSGSWITVFGSAMIAGLLASILLAAYDLVSVNVPIWWGLIQFAAVFILCSKSLKRMHKAVNKLHEQLRAFSHIVSLTVHGSDFKAAPNRSIYDTLNRSEQAIRQLERILGRLDRRGNALGLFFADALFLSDLFLIRDFLRWQNACMDDMGTWIDAVSRLDALVSMGTFRFNEPAAGTAEIVESRTVVYEAQGIWHPFIRQNAVANDFILTDRNYYIITGANMAGKSTFLRALGVNYILAMNGMPVFARRLRVSPFRLFTSMRTTDDLSHGISYFNAELLRLKQLISSISPATAPSPANGEENLAPNQRPLCEKTEDAPTLIILDEILKGTNSLDKLNGSRLFLESIADKNVTGVIATHDLELSKMADNSPDRYHNYCFEIELSSHITYSYKLTAGVARNQNATFLLREIIAAGGKTTRTDS